MGGGLLDNLSMSLEQTLWIAGSDAIRCASSATLSSLYSSGPGSLGATAAK